MANKIKFLVLSLTGRCNFACRYCYAADHDKSTMTSETALAAVNLAAASGEPFVIQFSGGEPLLNYPVIKTVVEYVRKHNIPGILQLQTNASLLTDEMAQFLFRNKVAIGVSLDGKPSVTDKLRLTQEGKGATELIVKGIDVLRRNNIACGVTCVVTSENVGELTSIVDFAYYLGNVRKIGFDLLRGQGRGVNLFPPSAEDMKQAIKQVYRRRDQLEMMTGLHIDIAQEERAQALQRDPSKVFGHCYAMNGEAAYVDAKGNIYACSSLIGDEEYKIGTVFDGRYEEDIERTKAFIRESMAFCRTCEDFEKCGGGCFTRWYSMVKKGDYGAECAMKRESIKQIRKI